MVKYVILLVLVFSASFNNADGKKKAPASPATSHPVAPQPSQVCNLLAC